MTDAGSLLQASRGCAIFRFYAQSHPGKVPQSALPVCAFCITAFFLQRRMLHIENLFLALNFRPKLLLGRKVSHVLGHEQPFIIMQYGISGNILVGLSAKQNPNGRIVALFALQVIVHPDIHVNLSYVLMGNPARF